VDAETRKVIVAELAAAFGSATDVTPAEDQPLHVLLSNLNLLAPWQPNPTSGLARFAGWPDQRPDFWVSIEVSNGSGPPRSSSEQLVLGKPWRQYSASITWPVEPRTATRAIQLWLNRFADRT